MAQIYVVKNDEEAIQLANDSHYGLGGAVFSQDIERAKRMASAIETGMVYINWLPIPRRSCRLAARSGPVTDGSSPISASKSL